MALVDLAGTPCGRVVPPDDAAGGNGDVINVDLRPMVVALAGIRRILSGISQPCRIHTELQFMADKSRLAVDQSILAGRTTWVRVCRAWFVDCRLPSLDISSAFHVEHSSSLPSFETPGTIRYCGNRSVCYCAYCLDAAFADVYCDWRHGGRFLVAGLAPDVWSRKSK